MRSTNTPGARLIAWAAEIVPFARRRDWRREWEAEVAYAWQRMRLNGRPTLMARARLYLRITTCVIDAFWERKQTMTMSGLGNDLRHAARGLVRYPTFTVIALITLALGIGANTAVFTLVDGVLLSPLPFQDADELVDIQHQGRDGQDELPMSDGLYVVYREQAASLAGLALWNSATVNLVGDGDPQRVPVQVVTPGYFSVLGVGAILGRTFLEEEGLPEAELVVVISDGFWVTTMGGDPAVIGRELDINGSMRRIVGVMPPGFGFPDTRMWFWLPYVVDPQNAPLAAFGAGAIGRLAPGSSVESLATETQGLITRLPELFPESGAVPFLQRVGLSSLVLPLKQSLVGNVASTLWILLGTVGFVLLIACANVANLLLVRAEGRQREMALRVAVGAGRLHVVRAYMSESLVLAGVGGALGTAIASLAVRVAVGLVPTDLPRAQEIGVDLRVMGFTAAITLGCAVFFGLFPLLGYATDNLAGQLRDGGARGATGGRGHHRLRNGLVITQMALALVLLVGSGLMFRSFQALRDLDPGFDAQNVLTARVTVPTAEVADWEEAAGLFRQLQQNLAAQPGVISVGMAQGAPLSSGLGYFSIEVEDHPVADDALPVFARNNQTEVGYLEAMGIDLLEGRTFRSGDGAEGARSVVVDESFARHWWPDASPIGRRVRLGFPEEDWYQIVGVVGNAHYESLEQTPDEMVYWPATVGLAADPQPTRGMDVVIKTATDPLAFIAVLRREVQALNPRIPISNPRSMEQVVAAATSRVSFTMTLLGTASGIALILGLVGIYGVISYVVSQRTREIGVRMALGATAASVRGMVVRQGMVLAGAGVGIGLIAAGAFSRVMTSLLFGVSATDPLTYGAVAVSLVAVALVASWLPAMRAASVDPSSALRSE